MASVGYQGSQRKTIARRLDTKSEPLLQVKHRDAHWQVFEQTTKHAGLVEKLGHSPRAHPPAAPGGGNRLKLSATTSRGWTRGRSQLPVDILYFE